MVLLESEKINSVSYKKSQMNEINSKNFCLAIFNSNYGDFFSLKYFNIAVGNDLKLSFAYGLNFLYFSFFQF